MTADSVIVIARDALYVIIITAAPGLVVSVFQTVTSIQEQTLTFVPKILGIFLTIMLLGHWMLNNIVTYMTALWNDIPLYIH